MKNCRIVLFLLALLTLQSAPLHAQTEQRAREAFAAGDYEAAANLWEMAADRTTSSMKAKQLSQKAQTARKAQQLQEDARAAWNSGNLDMAEKHYSNLTKLNPDDAKARQMLTEVSRARHLNWAMYYYDDGDYNRALEHFYAAGNQQNWSPLQKKAFYTASEQVDYEVFSTAPSSARESKALHYVAHYRDGEHYRDVSDWLFEHYMKRDDYDNAKTYAYSADQYSRLTGAMTGRGSRPKRSQSHSGLDLHWPDGLLTSGNAGIELSLNTLFDYPSEIAIPVELNLMPADRTFNIALGLRLGARGHTFKITDFYYDDQENKYHLEHRIGYYQLSPTLKIKYFAGNLFYLAVGGRMNYNFGHSYSYDVARYYGEGLLDYTRTAIGRERPANFLNPITFTGQIEAGIGGADVFCLYLYYSYDFTRPVDDNTLSAAMGNSATRLGHALVHTDIIDSYRKSGYLGIGLRLMFGTD